MKILLLLISMSLVSASNLFIDFKEKYNKNYDSLEEHARRSEIFYQNVEKINQHNMLDSDWKMAINEFADLTPEEFKSKYTGLRLSSSGFGNLIVGHRTLSVPTSLDWTTKGVVSRVKNQGSCGSCWAFSSTGALESAYAIKYGKLNTLSEQQLVDCSTSYGNEGCNGGIMDDAFKYVIDNGICSDTTYSYTASDGTCKKCSSLFKAKSFVDVIPNNETDLLQAVLKQPVSVAIEADQSVFQFYSSGVITSTSCGTSLDHGVLVVGFGVDSKTKRLFWKVKNSWGASWGENGYVRILRNTSAKQGMCGVAMMPSYPVV